MKTSTLLTQRHNLGWVTVMRVVAIGWIFIDHASEQVFGGPFMGNPWKGWAPFADRISQLLPLTVDGLRGVALNLFRYIGWTGEQGVQIFLILSGFGLTWGLLKQSNGLVGSLKKFYLRRAERIYPLWVGAHLFFVVCALFAQSMNIHLTDWRFYASLLGIRVTTDTIYYFTPAWWYGTLIIQLYLFYPVLWNVLNKLGPFRFFMVSCLVGFLARAVGLLIFTDYLDAWSRGAIFITKLPEFAFGMGLAVWYFQNPERTDKVLRRPLTILAALLSYPIGIYLGITLLGMSVAPFILGASSFILIYAFIGGSAIKIKNRLIEWLDQNSYGIYLLHHPWLILLMPVGLVSALRLIGGILISLIATLGSVILLDWVVMSAVKILAIWNQKWGLKGLVIRIGSIGIAIGVLVVGTELAIRAFSPQETLGWGERISLEPSSEFGWTLKPSTVTHLRWESYDYFVQSNSLGFPGPEYSQQKPASTFRIMTTGDAFTSAEGVNTDQAWPRILEDLLNEDGRKTQVLNFAITGYGPNQYEAVITRFAPVYHPDLILVGFFVNEYQDVQIDNSDFQASIGFNLPSQNGLPSILSLTQTQRYISNHIMGPIKSLIRNQPDPYGYFLGQFAFVEKDQPLFWTSGRDLVFNRLLQMKNVADKVGARLILVLIPAPVQVCGPDQLPYFPRGIDLQDNTKYDLNLPQRITTDIATSLNLDTIDLRSVLQSAAVHKCPYQPYNIHWTVDGQKIVATYLANYIESSLYK